LEARLIPKELLFGDASSTGVLQRDAKVEHGISVDVFACFELSVGVPVMLEALV
jgi:hypothetical protein